MPLGAVAAAAASVALIGAAASGAAGGLPAPPAALPSVTALAAVNDALGDSLALNGVKQLAAAWSAGAARADAGPAAASSSSATQRGPRRWRRCAARCPPARSSRLTRTRAASAAAGAASGWRPSGRGQRRRPAVARAPYVEAITTSAAARETFGVLERLIEATLAQPVPTDGGGAIRVAPRHRPLVVAPHARALRRAPRRDGRRRVGAPRQLRRLWSPAVLDERQPLGDRLRQPRRALRAAMRVMRETFIRRLQEFTQPFGGPTSHTLTHLHITQKFTFRDVALRPARGGERRDGT